MKIVKLFFVSALSVLALTANATVTQKASFKLIAPAYGFNKTLTIAADDAVTGQFATGSAEQAVNPAGDRYVNVYVLNNTTKYGTVVRPDINGLQFVAEANKKETAYKMVFSNVVGEFTISDGNTEYDVVDGDTIDLTMTTGGSITFTVAVPQNVYYRGNVTPLPADGFGTICLPWASTALEGAEFFEVLGKDATKGVALGKVTALEAGKPYVFKTGAESTQIKVTYDLATEVSTEVAVAGIVGSFDGCNVPVDMYIIQDNQLYKTADATSTIAANRAYFDLANMPTYSGNAPGRKVIFMGGKGISTGVEAAEAAPAMNGKVLMNGQLVIIRDGKMFNAQGAAL